MQRVWQLAMLVGLLMRWVRSQGRQLELLCCLEEAARRRHLALLVLRLVRREHLRWLREWQLERPWSEVVDRLRMWVQLQLRWLVLVVRVLQRHRVLLARRRVLLWWLRVDRHRRQLMQRVWRPGVLEHLWSRQRRSLVRLQVQRWCMVGAVSRRLWLRLGKRCVRREDRHMLRLRLRLR